MQEYRDNYMNGPATIVRAIEKISDRAPLHGVNPSLPPRLVDKHPRPAAPSRLQKPLGKMAFLVFCPIAENPLDAELPGNK